MLTAQAALLTGLYALLLTITLAAIYLVGYPYRTHTIQLTLNLPTAEASLIGSHARRKQVNCLAAVIYYEARGESENTQMAVAQVTVNRVKNKHYPNTVCGVVYSSVNKSCAYSWTCNEYTINEIKAWGKAVTMANHVYVAYYLTESIPDRTRGALFFVGDHTHRSWMHALRITMKSGKMVFLAKR